MRRWRSGNPLQRGGLPGVFRGLGTLEQTPDQIHQEQELSGRGYECRDGHKFLVGLERFQELELGRLRVAPQLTHDPHQMHGDENGVHSDEGQPEVQPSQPFVQHASKHLGEPVIGGPENTEDGCHPHDHVEVGYREVGIVKLYVHRGLPQEEACDASGDEDGDEADGEEHGGGETDLASPQGSQPVEGLDRRRHTDGQGQDGEHQGGKGAQAAHEHVVTPHEEAQHSDGEDGHHHGLVAEHGLPGEGRQQLGGHSHARKDGNVNFGVPEEPEEMLPQNGRATRVFDDGVAHHQTGRNEEAGPTDPVEQQQDSGSQQHRERKQGQNSRGEPGPDGKGHLHQRHSLGPHIENGGDEVEGAQQGSDTEEGDTDDPQILTRSQPRSSHLTQRTERGVGRPAGYRRPSGHKEGRKHHPHAQEGDPEGQHVQHRKGHVVGPDLDWQEVIAESALRSRGQHEEHHDGAVHGKHGQIELGRHQSALEPHGKNRLQPGPGLAGPGQPQPHQHGKPQTGENRDQRQEVILDPNDLMVCAEYPFAKKRRRCRMDGRVG